MAFFLIVPSVIIVTIFLVHALAERLGFHIKYFSLILCAFISFLVNVAAIEMSTYIDRWHYIRLGILILIASIIVTIVNKILVKREKLQPKTTPIEDEIALAEAEAEYHSNIIEIKKVDDQKSADNVETKIEEPAKITESIDDKKSDKIVESPKVDKIDKAAEVKKPVKVIDKPADDKKISDKPAENKIDKPSKVNLFDKPVEVKKDDQPTENKSTDKLTDKIDKVDDNKKSEVKRIRPGPAKVNKPQAKVDDKTQAENLKLINAHLDTLDDILDYAYSQKSKGDLNQAILAYQKALERYKNDEYAPFIAIDLGNIYKEQAEYTKVITTYEEALKLPAVIRSTATRKEFTKNLSYIKIVQSVLLRHRALTMPFSKIPIQYLQEIETEFKAAQLNDSTVKNKF
ncbi:MAG: hypothetical protein IJ728_11200 [Selenomonadaceae bacterium]|nr:hypothetical protein [Selenomonadaceae bacterium]